MITSKTFDILDKLANVEKGTGSRTEKLEILNEYRSYLIDYMQIAFNPYRVFHIVQIPKKSIELHKRLPATLEDLAEYLESQKGGTNLNKDLVALWLSTSNKYYDRETANYWCEQALLKNVKIGVDVKTLNKAGYNVPTFELLLASPNKDNSLEGIKEYPCIIQPKLDGVRCVYFPKLKQFMGRNGRIIPNVNLASHFDINTDMVLDGELYDENLDFNDIIGITSSDDKEVPKTFKFVVFNILTQEEWDNQECKTTYDSQIEKLKELQVDCSGNVVSITNHYTWGPESVMIAHANFIAEGYEGTMVRGLKSLYQWKRVKLNEDVLIKIKQSDKIDAEVINYYEGNDRHLGALGGLTVRLDNGVEVDVGGGYSDDLRKEMWDKRDALIGQWIHIKYTEKTIDGSLRFPIFNGIRDAK